MLRTTEERRPRSVALLIVIAVAIAIAGALWWWLSQPIDLTERLPVLTPEAKAYVKNLKLSDVEIKATENALGQTLVEILGRITNAGERPVKRAILQCVFYDPYGQVVARELVAIVREKDGILYPGETRKFRLPFDALPDTWNQAMPQLVIAEIIFGDES